MATNKTVNINNDSRPSSQFVEVAKWLLHARGRRQDAAAFARAGRASELVCEILEKAAVNSAVLTSPAWAGDAAAFQSLGAAYLDAVANVGIYDKLLPSMNRIPFHATGVIVTAGGVGSQVDEADWSPMSEIELAAPDPLTALKAVALVSVSSDVARSAAPDALALIRRSLVTSTALVTDREFLSAIAPVAPAASSSGSDVDSVRADMAALLQAVGLGQMSKPFLIMSSANAKAIATMGGGGGDFPFNQMGPQGGTLCGVPVLVADAIATDELMLIDASGIVASSGVVTLETAEHATLRMSSTPSSEATLTNLWQANLSAIKCCRWFSARRVRDDAVAVVDGVNYAGGTA